MHPQVLVFSLYVFIIAVGTTEVLVNGTAKQLSGVETTTSHHIGDATHGITLAGGANRTKNLYHKTTYNPRSDPDTTAFNHAIEKIKSYLRSNVDATMCDWRYNYRTSSYENSCDPEPLETELKPPTFSTVHKPKAKRKPSERPDKFLNANFVLVNKGIDYKQKDDVQNSLQEAKMAVNCVLLVAKDNQCYGWQKGPQGRFVKRPYSGQLPPPLMSFLPMFGQSVPEEVPVEEPGVNPVEFFAKMFLRKLAPNRRRARILKYTS